MNKERFWLSKEGIGAATLMTLIGASLTLDYLADVKERRRIEDRLDSYEQDKERLSKEINYLKSENQKLKDSQAKPEAEPSNIEDVIKAFGAQKIKKPSQGEVYDDGYSLDWNFGNFTVEQIWNKDLLNSLSVKYQFAYKGHQVEVTESEMLFGCYLVEMYDKDSISLDQKVREMKVFIRDELNFRRGEIISEKFNPLPCCNDISDQELADIANNYRQTYDDEIGKNQPIINAIMKDAVEREALKGR